MALSAGRGWSYKYSLSQDLVAVGRGEDAHTKHHLSTQAGWPCSTTGPGELPWHGAGSKGCGAASQRHHQPPLDTHPRHAAQGLERRDMAVCGFFLVFFKGFSVCLLLISLKSQIFGHVPWLTEK